MNPKLKISLYAGLLIAAIIFGALFYSSYKRLNEQVQPQSSEEYTSAAISSEINQETNAALKETNETQTTNLTGLTNEAEARPETNAIATNPPSTNVTQQPETVSPVLQVARPPTQGRSSMIGYFAAFLGVAIFLGLLIARDISEYFGSRSVEFMFNDEGTGIKNPEYEEAEQEWANGHHLEAIRMMRDYLTKHPREQYVALRIAEIYEKDLKNHLAAALEYEEILKHKLPPQRWGWAAIHLCNLYSKLGKTEQSVALLRRIVNEYGETPAAEKARKRLAMFETVGEEGLDGDLPDAMVPPPKPPRKEAEPPESSNLPPGFRPKK